MDILILGAGGVGGYFGARLHQGGGDVTFLVRPGRAAALAEGGLAIASPLGDYHCRPRTLEPGGRAPAFGLVILACKAYDLASAIAAVHPWVGPETRLLPLLNGVAHLDALDQAFGRVRVLGGVAHLSVTRQPDGTIAHLNGHHRLIAGLRGRDGGHALSRLQGLLDRSGVDCRISGDIEQDLWEKFVFLATLAGATAALRTSIGRILETDFGAGFISGLLEECVAIARAGGWPPRPQELAAYRAQLLEPGSPLKSSLLRDLEQGRRTEGEHILGDLVRRGHRAGLRTALLSLCHSRVAAWEGAGFE